MIKFINKDKMKEFLLTTDFNDVNLTPLELKDLLSEFKYLYRLQHSELNNKEHNIYKGEAKLKSTKDNLKKSEKKYELLSNKHERLKNKKLSWKQRLKGKIV